MKWSPFRPEPELWLYVLSAAHCTQRDVRSLDGSLTRESSTSWLLVCAPALRASILPIESRFCNKPLKMRRQRPL